MSSPEHQHREDLQLVLTHFRRKLARTESSIEVALAGALQRLFLQATVTVLSSIGEEESTGFSGAQSIDAGKVERLKRDEIEHFLSLIERSYPVCVSLKTFQRDFRCLEHGRNALGLTAIPFSEGEKPTHSPTHADIWLIWENLVTEEHRSTAEWLQRNITGLGELSETVDATHSFARVTRLRRRAEAIRFDRSVLLSERLRKAVRLTQSIQHSLRPGTVDQFVSIVDDLGLWAVQEILGSEWHSTSGDAKLHEQRVRAFFEAVIDTLQSAASIAIEPRSSDLTQAQRRAKCYQTIACRAARWWKFERLPLGTPLEDDQGESLLTLLARWSRMHQIAHELSIRPKRISRGQYESDWRGLVAEARGPLRTLLARGWSRTADTEIGSPGLTRIKGLYPWLSAWLALSLLDAIHEAAPKRWRREPPTLQLRWAFRKHLALLVRETWRQAEMGDKPGFTFDAASYLDASRTVVVNHAHGVIGLPRKFDLEGHLSTLSEARDADDWSFAAGHLQHALQVYMVGHFMASLKLEVPSESVDVGDFHARLAQRPWTVIEALASQDGQDPGKRTQSLLQAFSLAALLHDVGMLVFPRIAFPKESFREREASLEQRVAEVRKGIEDTASALMTSCRDAMSRGARYIKATDRRLSEWLEEQGERGHADHSLLGAWYLERVCASFGELSPNDVVAPAVRAVLLHAVLDQPIDSKADPIAALLVLCDELLDWLPNMRTAAVPGSTVTIGPRELDVRDRGSRARSFQFPGLRYHEDGHWYLAVHATAQGWPSIELRLQDADHLDVPVCKTLIEMTENLSRLSRTELGWAPQLRIRFAPEQRMQAVDLKLREALEEMATDPKLTFRNQIIDWLEDFDDENTEEVLRIFPKATVPTRRLGTFYAAIKSALGKVVEKAEKQDRSSE